MPPESISDTVNVRAFFHLYADPDYNLLLLARQQNGFAGEPTAILKHIVISHN